MILSYTSCLLFSRSVMPYSLWPCGLQHAKLPCSSPSSGACSNLMLFELVMPSNHLALCRPLFLLLSVFSSIKVFSNESTLCLRWPACIIASASASVLLMNIQDWFPLGLTGLISLSLVSWNVCFFIIICEAWWFFFFMIKCKNWVYFLWFLKFFINTFFQLYRDAIDKVICI